MRIDLTPEQVDDLARPLMSILEKFYQDPTNEEEFRKWLLSVEKESEVSHRAENVRT